MRHFCHINANFNSLFFNFSILQKKKKNKVQYISETISNMRKKCIGNERLWITPWARPKNKYRAPHSQCKWICCWQDWWDFQILTSLCFDFSFIYFFSIHNKLPVECGDSFADSIYLSQLIQQKQHKKRTTVIWIWSGNVDAFEPFDLFFLFRLSVLVPTCVFFFLMLCPYFSFWALLTRLNKEKENKNRTKFTATNWELNDRHQIPIQLRLLTGRNQEKEE